VTGSGVPDIGDAVAVVVARDGRLPVGADEAVAEAGGTAIVVGTGAHDGALALVGADRVWWAETGAGLRPAALTDRLAPLLAPVALVVLPASPDGRDLAPRLAASLGRPLIASAIRVECGTGQRSDGGPRVRAEVARLDDRLLIPVEVDGPAVATLVPGSRAVVPARTAPTLQPLPMSDDPGEPEFGGTAGPDPQLTAMLEPDPRTMDLADATRVMAGGAGLVAGTDDRQAVESFDLLARVAAAIGGSAGATRVATDAGWTGYERQIGTTGVTIDPELYIAFGVSGATQHTGGLGTPRHIVSVNTDASSPMTAMADLGLVTDARSLLEEVGRRFGVDRNNDQSGPDAAASTGPGTGRG
jgi:electron transfer flavoprotein alpha subunit